MRSFRVLAPVAGLCALLFAADIVPPAQDRLWECRNLGKAFYENPDTHLQAVEQLRAALQLAPDSVRERINYGLALLHAGQTQPGMAELTRAQTQDATSPHTWSNLAIAQ